MNNKILSLLAIVFMIGLTSCGDDKEETQTLNLNLQGLSNVGPDYAYEGWIMVDGTPKTTGVFTIDDNGTPSSNAFEIATEDLEVATAFILTIEPSPDSDPAPSDVHILAGDFTGNSSSLTVDHGAALGTDFTSSTGGYILATPTDTDDTNELSGVWFLDNRSGSAAAALDLPSLPAGWAYEGWAVIDGSPISTGTFTSASGADASGIFSGENSGPPYPGEDFLRNAPSGLTFPTNLQSGTIVVSVEPVPDNSPAPFVLKPLVGQVDGNAADHTFYDLENNATNTNPTGVATR